MDVVAGSGAGAGVALGLLAPNKLKVVLRAFVSIGARKYLDPEPVCTTVPAAASPLMGDVVTDSPSSNAGDPVMKPEIEPSRFCVHWFRVGTPLGATAATVFATFAGAGAEGGVAAGLAPPPNPPKRLMLAPGAAFSTAFFA